MLPVRFLFPGLSGVTVLDAVTEQVARRLAEMQGVNRLADQVA